MLNRNNQKSHKSIYSPLLSFNYAQIKYDVHDTIPKVDVWFLCSKLYSSKITIFKPSADNLTPMGSKDKVVIRALTYHAVIWEALFFVDYPSKIYFFTLPVYLEYFR